MKKIILPFLILIIFLSFNQKSEQKFYNEKFKWEIIIPEGFEKISAQESEYREKKGLEILSKNFDGEIEDKRTSIFEFKNGRFNTMEANYTPFDSLKGWNYTEIKKEVQKIYYKSFLTLPSVVKVDTISKKESIAGREFELFETKIIYENNKEMYSLKYFRLIDNYDFVINLSYIDKDTGEKMINSVLTSKFRN